MSGTAITVINQSRTILSVVKPPVKSGSGKKAVMTPISTVGQKNTKMKIQAGAFIK